jgi:hypothetical protein
MYPVVLLIGALAVASLNLAFDKATRTAKRMAELYLFYLLLICVGLGGLLGFLGHVFRANAVAGGIGWPAENPFQFEVGVANLAFGVLGILCTWYRRNFWLATGLGSSIFLLGAACGHIREIIVHHNYSPYNAGAVLYVGDILVPILILVLLAIYFRALKKTP